MCKQSGAHVQTIGEDAENLHRSPVLVTTLAYAALAAAGSPRQLKQQRPPCAAPAELQPHAAWNLQLLWLRQ